MSRIAVVADIHANMPALDAVVADIDRRDVDEVLVGGDLVGRGPQGRRVVETVDELGWSCIRGNHEDYVLQFRRRDVPDDWLEAEIWAASRWMADELGDWHETFIDSLPFSTTAESAPGLRLVHGSPTSYHEGLGEWTSEETLREHLDSIDERLLVCAHTHRPLHRELSAGQIVNVGSVGLPFNGDSRAHYAIFESSGDGWEVEFRRIDYDRNRFLEIYEETGFLEEGGITASILRMEVETARPYVVPFRKWAEIEGVRPTESNFAEFLEIYDDDMSLRSFFSIVREEDDSFLEDDPSDGLG